MITRSLSKRLEKLERLIPTGEPIVIQIVFVSARDGSVKDGPRITIGGSPKTPIGVRAEWQRGRPRNSY